jgi:hypothetical protein
MTSTIKQVVGTRTAVTISLNSLASATYVQSSDVDFTTNQPVNVALELAITPGTVSGNKKAHLFAVVSLDGTNYTTGPTSSTSATDEENHLYVGSLPLNTNSTLQRKVFNLVDAIGWVPPHAKFVVRNDSGAAFSGSNCTLYYSEISATVV